MPKLKRTKRNNNRLHTEHSAGVLPENACLSCPVNLERYADWSILRISEKTVELSFCSQLSVLLNQPMIWFGLTQQQEAEAGFDACSRIGATIVLLQFKASSRDVRGCRRFTAKHQQMENLQSWCHLPIGVFYVLPMIGTTDELNQNQDFVANSWLLDVRDLPSPMPPPTTSQGTLRRSGIHYVDVDSHSATATIHSDPFDVPLLPTKSLYRQIADQPSVQDFEIRELGKMLLDQPKTFWRNAVAVGFLPANP